MGGEALPSDENCGEENWVRARERKSTLEEKCKFVTFVLDRMLSPDTERKKSEVVERKITDKTPRDSGPADTTVQIRPLSKCVVTEMWRASGSMVNED